MFTLKTYDNILDTDVYTVNNVFIENIVLFWDTREMNDLTSPKESQVEEKKPYHHGNLGETLLEKAVLRIREHGVEKLSLRAIAKDAGVSQTALYRHFRDKNHLLSTLATEAFLDLAAVTAKASNTQESATDKLRAIGHAYISYAESHPEKYKLMFGPMIQNRGECPELAEAGEQAYAVVYLAVEAGIEQGLFIQIHPQVLANSCWSMVHGIASLIIDGFFHQTATDLNPKNPSDCPTTHGEVDSLEEFIDSLLMICNRGISTR